MVILDFFTALIKGYLILLIIWLITLIIVLVTLFRRSDIGFSAKLIWAVIIFIAPLIGLIFYLIFGVPKRKKLLEKTEKHPINET